MRRFRLTTIVGILTAGLTCGVIQAQTPAPGGLDTTFGKGGVATLTIHNAGTAPLAAFEQASGDIVVVGGTVTTNQPTNLESVLIARFTSAGVLDQTFGTKGITTTGIVNVTIAPRGASVLSNGDILVAADAGPVGAINPVTFVLVAYTSSGAVDTTFGNNGIVNDAVGNGDASLESFMVQPNGQIIMAGSEPGLSRGASTSTILVRFNPNGSLDTTFGEGGIVQSAPSVGGATTIALLSNGDYLVLGTLATAEFSSTGTRLSTVTTDTVVAFGTTAPTLFQSNGEFISAGGAAPPTGSVIARENARVATALAAGTRIAPPNTRRPPQPGDVFIDRFTEPGIADPTFTPTTFAYVNPTTTDTNQSSASLLAFTPSGQIIAAGRLSGTASGSPVIIGIARLDANGGLDSSFGSGGAITNSAGVLADGVLVESNSDIVLLTETPSTNGTASLELVRFLGN